METPPPRIIFVTGYGNFSRREIFGLGVEALLDKPLSRPLLLDALARCLMDSAEKWLTPSPQPIAQRIVLELEGMKEAAAASTFTLGRGGCCVACDLPLKEESPVDLSVRFAREGLGLEAQGTVVWVDAEQKRAGVAFDYLQPECRPWPGSTPNGPAATSPRDDYITGGASIPSNPSARTISRRATAAVAISSARRVASVSVRMW